MPASFGHAIHGYASEQRRTTGCEISVDEGFPACDAVKATITGAMPGAYATHMLVMSRLKEAKVSRELAENNTFEYVCHV